MKRIVSQKGLKVLSTLTKPIAFNFSRLVAFAKPANCVLLVKIKFLPEKRSTTHEKPAIADDHCYVFGVLTRKPPMYKI